MASPDKLSRIVGHLKEPGSGDEASGANPFDLADSSDDELGQDGAVVDRCGVVRRLSFSAADSTCLGGPCPPNCLLACSAAPAPALFLSCPRRQYLKHRAHKLTNPKTKGHQGGSPGSTRQ